MDKIYVLAADNIEKEGTQLLRDAGFTVEERGKIPADELATAIPSYDVLIVRSATKVPASVIENAARLKIIGRAGVGIDNVDVAAATARGIIVMNAPEGNTLSAAEHTLGLILCLARKIPQAVSSVKSGKWDRKSYMGTELYGKTLGIIGLGRIGRRVAQYGQALGMKILGYDPFVSIEDVQMFGVSLVTLEGLCRQADIITLHLPLTDQTRGILGEGLFNLMKPGVWIVNVARGGLIDEGLLYRQMVSGKVAGAAIDVFAQEPPTCKELLALDNVIATPHLGASTREAQVNVARDICKQVVDALTRKIVRNAVNVPQIDEDILGRLGRFLSLSEKMGQFISQMGDGLPDSISIEYAGDITDDDVRPLTAYLLKGFMEKFQQVTYVNAQLVLREKGVRLHELRKESAGEFSSLITVATSFNNSEVSVAGTVVANAPKIVKIDGFDVEATPEGYLLVCHNDDRPGIMGHIGTILGKASVNIASMTLGRREKGGPAITVLNLDQEISEQTINEIGKFSGIRSTRLVKL